MQDRFNAMVAAADLNSLTSSSIGSRRSLHDQEEKKRSELDAEAVMRQPGWNLREERRGLLTNRVHSEKYTDAHRNLKPDGFGAKRTTLERLQQKQNLTGDDINKIRKMGLEMPKSGASLASQANAMVSKIGMSRGLGKGPDSSDEEVE